MGRWADRKTNEQSCRSLLRAFRDFVKDRKLLLSAPSSFPAVGRCLQIKHSTARVKIMKAANVTESNNFNPFKTDTANNLIAFTCFVHCSLINQRGPFYVRAGRLRPLIFVIRVLFIQHEYGTLVE